jgi:hypothetical protein
MAGEGNKHRRTSLIRLLYFILFAAIIFRGFNLSLSRRLLALPPVLWGACPPLSYTLPKSSYRLARLVIALVVIYITSVFLLWAVYEWDRNVWEIPSAVVLTLAAFVASSRLKRWAELPEKRFASIEEVIPFEADWVRRRRTTIGMPPPSIPAVDPNEGSNIVGLALSGGGIR